MRGGLRTVIPRPGLFKALLGAGNALKPLMPASLKDHLPREIRPAKPRPQVMHQRRVLMLEGCVQPSLSPNTNAAAARVLDRLGISVSPAREAGCCGAVDYHLNAQEAGFGPRAAQYRRRWPAIEAGAEAIVQTASGCGAFVKEYGHLLKDDPAYAAKAARVSELAMTRRSAAQRRAGKARRACRQAHGLPLPVHPAARTEARRRGRRRAHPSATSSLRCPMRTCAAARPAAIRSPSRRFPTSCVTTSSTRWRAASRK